MFKKIFIWILIFNSIIYFMMTQYCHSYLDAQSDMLNVKFNLSTSYKRYFIITLWLLLPIIFLPIMYYSYFYILSESYFYLMEYVTIIWFFWDFYPILMTDNGFKINNIIIALFDCTYAGGFWVLISLYIFNNYYNIIKKSNVLIFLLFLLNIFLILLFFYTGFIYNREYIVNNWLVNLGDYLRWDILINYIKLNLYNIL